MTHEQIAHEQMVDVIQIYLEVSQNTIISEFQNARIRVGKGIGCLAYRGEVDLVIMVVEAELKKLKWQGIVGYSYT